MLYIFDFIICNYLLVSTKINEVNNVKKLKLTRLNLFDSYMASIYFMILCRYKIND